MKISNYNIIKKIDNNIVVYNSYSKASLFLEENSDTNAFKNIEDFNKLPEDQQRILINNGFVVEDNRDELSELKYIYEQKYFETKLFNLILVPSLACNFNCPYCFEKDLTCGKQNIKKYFTVLKKFAVKNFHTHSIVQISLFGGEPLLYANECIEFLNWVKEDSEKNKYHFFTSVVTNGSLLTEEILIGLLKNNLRSLQITIDSDEETHNKMRAFKNGTPSFDILMDKINMVAEKEYHDNDFKFIVRINLNNTSVEKVKKALEHIKNENRKNVHLLIRAIYNTHKYNEENSNSVFELKEYFDLGTEMGFNILKEKFHFQTCEACGDRKNFYLMPDLSLWKCINDLNFEKSRVGVLSDEGDPLLNAENIVNWYKKCMSAFTDQECLDCKLLPDCLGGCPLYKCKNNKKSCRSFDMSCLPFIY